MDAEDGDEEDLFYDEYYDEEFFNCLRGGKHGCDLVSVYTFDGIRSMKCYPLSIISTLDTSIII